MKMLFGHGKFQPNVLTCLLALLCFSPTRADDVARVETIIRQLKEKQTQDEDKIELLGALGSDSASALPFLLSDEFYGGVADKNPSLKQATVNALARIGEPAIAAVVDLLAPEPVASRNANPDSQRSEKKLDKKAAARAKKQREARRAMARDILRNMARTDAVDMIVPALDKQMQGAQRKEDHYALLALMGPKSIPVLQREARALAAKERLSKADANNIRRMGNLIGNEVGPSIGAVIPSRWTEDAYQNERYRLHYASGFWPMAHAKPDPKHIPTFLDFVKNDNVMRGYYHRTYRLVAMVLSGMGDAAALPLAELLRDPNPQTRWAGATILGMIGPDMKVALPALEMAYRNRDEDVAVRVAAARAMASIQSADPFELYKSIPDVQQRIVARSRKNRTRSMEPQRWLEHFKTDPDKTRARQLALYNGSITWERPLYDLAVGENVKTHNESLRKMAAEKLANLPPKIPASIGYVLHTEAHTFLLLFGSTSSHFPGRLEADVEKSLKEICFAALNVSKVDNKPRYIPKTTEQLRKLLSLDDKLSILEMSNGPMRSEANQYLVLQVLKDDPAFAQRKFDSGDTVQERYEAFTQFMRRGIKSLALHGMWSELGSSNYENKTYRGLLALVDFATDPVVAARARMFMDLAMVELEQISLSGLRGGSKTRAKDGGLIGGFNKVATLLHGEHHGFMLEPPGFRNAYQPPTAATLLRRLGPTKPVYEIINRHVSEEESIGEAFIPQKSKAFVLPGRSINYAYCTPEYVTGCAMFDVRLWQGQGSKRALKYGTMGRWSGVIFRNRGGVYLEAYTGEKWNVQHKDVMIAQTFRGSRYTGHPRVDFASIMDMVERDGWVFVHNHGAYVAIRVARGGYYWNEPARRRLYLNDAFSPIILQTGRQADYKSFDRFQQAILAAPLTLTEDKLDYTGPNSSRVEFFLCKDSADASEAYPASLPKINGVELKLNLAQNYRSPFMNNRVGSDVVTVSYGDREWKYDFEKNTVTERK